MPRYVLFAARDGDVLHSIGEFRDSEAAERWAAREMDVEFDLRLPRRTNFYDAIAATDGVLLEEQDDLARNELLLAWAASQVATLKAFEPQCGRAFHRQREACRKALLALAVAADGAV